MPPAAAVTTPAAPEVDPVAVVMPFIACVPAGVPLAVVRPFAALADPAPVMMPLPPRAGPVAPAAVVIPLPACLPGDEPAAVVTSSPLDAVCVEAPVTALRAFDRVVAPLEVAVAFDVVAV